ncbi:folylpolyglutamate synthase [Bacteroidia bacterium]|nr:folylpolyglutamate synthase [Bacteroidia bacterium]
MTYEETIHYLYTSTPVFQHSGASAYKPGLDTSIALDNHLGNPHRAYPTIHVGGTNGKGSISHVLATILQKAGFRVGLYTSPHLLDFRERIRVDGQMISKEYVVNFVEDNRDFFEPLQPSFFELTSTMAFAYFRAKHVDIAIIEVGLGGRLDSTNIITPILSIITNISKDHTAQLGDTLEQIASEKAGIIKDGVPVVIGEAKEESVYHVFLKKAIEMHAPILFAEHEKLLVSEPIIEEGGDWTYESVDYGFFYGELKGLVQVVNTITVLCALRVLDILFPEKITRDAVAEGFHSVTSLTNLRGRWEKLMDKPYIVADTGHNIGAWNWLAPRINREIERRKKVYIILGFSGDKDVDAILQLLPLNAFYFFTNASSERALSAVELAKKAEAFGLQGITYPSIFDALEYVIANADDEDFVFIGGSNFVVAEVLPAFENDNK